MLYVASRRFIYSRWHGCSSCKPENRDDSTKGWSLNQKLERTKKTEEYIKAQGFHLVTMWECEWKQHKELHSIHNRYAYPTEAIYRMSETMVLEEIKNGRIFGAVQVDIHVPESLKGYFQEMPPIFKNVPIKYEDIGVFMQNFLEETGRTFKDTKYLIGSMFGEKILITTPLLVWYMDHGLIVTRVWQVIEFKPAKCFKGFADTVSNDRRAGDQNPNLKAIADTSKLIGNSFYGYTIMNKMKHHDVKFLAEEAAVNAVNNPRFISLEEFDGCYEV